MLAKDIFKTSRCCGVALLVMAVSSCSRPAPKVNLKEAEGGSEYSGFLSTYAHLKPNPNFENTMSYVSADPAKNIHRYVAVIVDTPTVYISADATANAVPDRGVWALRDYFQNAISGAIEDAFPVVQSSGPLVLRLRSAIVGIDVGPQLSADQKGPNTLERALNIGRVGVEMELVDSETGQQIAAAVDRLNLGEGAVVGSVSFSREEKFRAATEAFDGWASRLRQFLDSAEELTKEDVDRVEATNFPYASEDTPPTKSDKR
jgi:hypothetical protein